MSRCPSLFRLSLACRCTAVVVLLPALVTVACLPALPVACPGDQVRGPRGICTGNDQLEAGDSANLRVEGADTGNCNDGADNDADGLFDCNDPDCDDDPNCEDDDDDTGNDDDDTDDAGDDDTGNDDDDDTDNDDDDTDNDDDDDSGCNDGDACCQPEWDVLGAQPIGLAPGGGTGGGTGGTLPGFFESSLYLQVALGLVDVEIENVGCGTGTLSTVTEGGTYLGIFPLADNPNFTYVGGTPVTLASGETVVLQFQVNAEGCEVVNVDPDLSFVLGTWTPDSTILLECLELGGGALPFR